MRKETGFLLIIFSLFSCQYLDSSSDVFIAQCHDNTLYYSDIQHLVPIGLEANDSINLVHSIREKWVKEQLLLQKAKLNLPLTQQQVRSQVVSYENALIIHAYQKELVNQKLDTVVTQEEIEDYFENNKSNFILDQDIVSVNFIKLNKEVPYLWKIRSLYSKTDEESKVKLEDYCYQFAQSYFLKDSWQYLSDVLLSLPKDVSLQNQIIFEGKSLELTDDNFRYFLYVKKYRLKGSVSPVTMVQNKISSIIINRRKIEFLKSVESELYQTALSNNQITYEKK